MSEWFKEPVLKTGDTATYRGFESHSLRFQKQEVWKQDHAYEMDLSCLLYLERFHHMQKYPSGEGAPLLRE